MSANPTQSDMTPRHGDTWERNGNGGRVSVMHVCGHHEPPHVTGYWHDADGRPDPCAHISYPLPRFLAAFAFVEREVLDGWP